MAEEEMTLKEFKAQASRVLRKVQEQGARYLITRRGRPWGRLVPAGPGAPGGGRRLLRGAYRDLPELGEEAFAAAKALWTRSR